MAIRQIRLDGDPILRKKSRNIEKVDDRIRELLDDMAETMYDANGVGLAAPQVGILRRAIVVDDGDGLYKMINPVISNKNGKISDIEGCLSVPDRNGYVDRPNTLRVDYMDENGDKQTLEARGLLARIICHEVDHLNGILYTDLMTEEVFLEDIVEENGDN